MEQRVCLSEEHGTSGRNSDSSVFQVKIRAFDRHKDIPQMCGLLYSALLEANHEDLSQWIDVVTLGGELKIPMQEVEARLYGYLHAGNEIVVAEEDEALIGFLIVQPIFIGTIAIRIMYLEPDLRGKSLAYDLVNSLKPKYVLFQTRRDIEPEQCLDVTADKRRCVMMDEKMITWQMKWGE